MTKIGMIVAVETHAIFEKYKDIETLPAPKGFELFLHKEENFDLYIMHCGMGTINAAAGTQLLIDRCNVDLVVDFGVVGGLTEAMKVQKIVVIDRVVHYRYDASEFMNLKIGQLPEHDDIYVYTDQKLVQEVINYDHNIVAATIASGDKFVSKAEDKKYIHDTFNADVCDMEAIGIALTCEANNVPCLLIKAVSDSITGGAEEFWKEINEVSLYCLNITISIIKKIYN